MNKKIGIVGSSHLGFDFNSPVRLKDCDKPKEIEIIVIEDKKTITVNGIEYERIPKKPKETGRKSALIAMMNVFEITNPYAVRSVPKRLPVIDIEAEFELIQQKKSKLSRSKRDLVENAFFKMYKLAK